ncbi:FxSxx-COOH system tetratricopeptide repeat protein [Sphaerisporangium perillae]|uniref:FxSxx-COOH system tetratricopeptide repeat protein n=1 Tax=Sphaerisporangium perillae TaxID=2935860 RepID=UPI00200BA56C|nr:FxSxx-COOH system tetratricopeptide repeat protein [Sphaerisporangium perillae]
MCEGHRHRDRVGWRGQDIKDFIPHGGPGHVLITSRNARWSGVAETLPVDVFTRDESLAFLAKRLRRTIDPSDADRLAAELGDLPLALEQAAALQLQTGISIDEYIELLRAQTRELLKLGKATEYPLSMTAAWQLSLQQIEERVPEAAEVLRCCAFFSPEPIPHDLFRRGNKTAGVKRMGPILSAPLLLTQALGELGRFALVRVDPDAGTIQVHRLVQALIRDSLDEHQRGEIRHEVHLLLAGGAPADPEDTDKWRNFADLVPHVGPSGLAECMEPGPREFATNIVRYLYRIGNYQLAKSFAEDFLKLWSEMSGPRHPDVLVLRRILGNILWLLGEYEASRLLNEETLEWMRQAFGDAHEETLRMSNQYGANLRAAGDFQGAREQDALSRAAHERELGTTNPATLRVINNLALDHVLLSDYKAGRELHELAYLEQSSAVAGVGKWDVLASWTSFARVVRLSGDYYTASDMGEEAYAYGRRELTLEHPVTLSTAQDLSIARRRSGDLDGALELAREVLERAEKLFGRNNPLTMAAAVGLANTLRRAGDFDEAFALTRDTVPRYERIYGPDHPFSHGCRTNLALLYRHRGDAVRARELDERALSGLVARLGEDHEYTFTCAINLASDLAASAETRMARDLGERTLLRLRGFFGEDHFLTLASAVNLVFDRRADGAEEEADALHKDTFARYERTLQADHPDRVQAEKGGRIDWDFDPPPI